MPWLMLLAAQIEALEPPPGSGGSDNKTSVEAHVRKIIVEILGVLAIMGGSIAAAGVSHTLSGGRQLLPRTFVPSRYELSLIPSAEALTFKGQCKSLATHRPAAGRR